MKRYQYQISSHPLRRENKMRIFCSEKGECSVEEVGPSDSQAIMDALDELGEQGWELVQLLFGKDGFVCLWKRESIPEGGTVS